MAYQLTSLISVDNDTNVIHVSGSLSGSFTGPLYTDSEMSASRLAFSSSVSYIDSIGNSYINFYPRTHNSVVMYNANATAEATRVGIGNIAGGVIQGARYDGAMLVIESTTKGFLLPRTNAITSLNTGYTASAGLMFYMTGSTNEGVYYYNSGSLKGVHKILSNSGSQDISGSVTLNDVLTLTPVNTLPSGRPTGSIAVSSSLKPFFYNGTVWREISLI